jgi:putative NADH-flavin reductase
MRVLVLGATGRVGAAALKLATAQGHEVIAFVRDRSKITDTSIEIATGVVTKPDTVAAALGKNIDAVINALGVDPLKPSTFVTKATRTVTNAMNRAGLKRYVAVSGTAKMPTTLGGLALSVLECTPVRHAIKDHRGAFDIVKASGLTWTLAGCPWIKDGLSSGVYTEHEKFPGGLKSIVPGDVAQFFVKVLGDSA